MLSKKFFQSPCNVLGYVLHCAVLIRDSLAQSVEHLTFNQGVPDSSSGRITKAPSSRG